MASFSGWLAIFAATGSGLLFSVFLASILADSAMRREAAFALARIYSAMHLVLCAVSAFAPIGGPVGGQILLGVVFVGVPFLPVLIPAEAERERAWALAVTECWTGLALLFLFRLPPASPLPLPELDEVAAGVLLSLVVFSGQVWFRAFYRRGLWKEMQCWYAVSYLAGLATLAQVLPFVCLAHGMVDGRHGIPWFVHVVYAALLAASGPVTTGGVEPMAVLEGAKVPVLGLQGSCLAQVYLQAMDVLFRADQYLDALTVCIACDVGSRYKSLLLLAYFASIALQPLLSAILQRSCSEEEEAGKSGKVTELQKLLLCTFFGFSPATLRETPKAWLELTRFCTENLPQPILQILFSLEMRQRGHGSVWVYVSLLFSFLLALKTLVSALATVWDRLARGCGMLGAFCFDPIRADDRSLLE